MLKFYYNVLVDEENFADRKEELNQIFEHLVRGRRVCLIGPRRYGKSSIAKNILPKRFTQKYKKKALPIYIDFMGVEDEKNVSKRISQALIESLANYIPQKMLAISIKSFFKNLAITLQPDPNTGLATFEIKGHQSEVPDLAKLLHSIAAICHEYQVLLIFDEFQDINPLKSVQGELRSFLQGLKDVPILFLGSKKKLMIQMFLNHNSPFFGFATELNLAPIPLEAWIPFFAERLSERGLIIEKDALLLLTEMALNVPNTICEIGAFIHEQYAQKRIKREAIPIILHQIVQQKKSIFQEQLLMLSSNELKIAKLLAQKGFIQKLYSSEFSQLAGLSSSGFKKIIDRLYKIGFIQEDHLNYRISNPLLGYYLASL